MYLVQTYSDTLPGGSQAELVYLEVEKMGYAVTVYNDGGETSIILWVKQDTVQVVRGATYTFVHLIARIISPI